MDLHSSDGLVLKVADRVSAMLAFWDKKLICRFANSAYLDWFGKTKEEMINKITLQELLGPLFEKNAPYIHGALNGEVQTFEREIPSPSGIRYALANYYPEIIEGEVQGFFVHVADVTNLKLMEKEILESNKKVNQQNKQLLNFSNIITHNLKTYSINLAHVTNLYKVVEKPEEKNQLFEFISQISKGLSNTITHMNEISKSHNLLNEVSEKINLFSEVERIKNILGIELKSANATIFNTISHDIELVANPAYVESIILNLFTNAIKYRKSNVAPIIEFMSNRTNECIQFIIRDNGRGINLEKYGSAIFGMYKTFHGNPDAEGIGLFLIKYQIEAMGGSIRVESEEHMGSTFIVSFNA